jgi:uncharacterized Zn finger protein (UPF0148 family)
MKEKDTIKTCSGCGAPLPKDNELGQIFCNIICQILKDSIDGSRVVTVSHENRRSS